MNAEPKNPHWQFPGCPDAPNWSLDFRALVSRFPWLRAMAGCPQDPQWHAEGDVLTHVGMVCEQTVAMDAWRALAPADRHLVFAAAMLHDVAKPMFTKVEDGRIRSRGHAVGGTRVARRILAEDPAFGPAGTPFPVREQICALVRHHGLPSTFLEKADPQRALLMASMTARCDLLAVLAEADMRGRVCVGRDDAVDRVALFRDFIAECGCAAAPYSFASDHSRFHYFRTAGVFPTIDLFDASHCTVTLLSGLPAAGKDTWVRANAGDQPVIALDALREEFAIDPGDDQGPVIHAAKDRAKVFLRRHESFVWNATNTTRMLRDGLIDLFTAYGARVRIVYCEAPFVEIRRRNRARKHPVPQRIIEKLIDHLDVPDTTEAQEVLYAIT
ncbi:MAG TPA: AAA family ATPase [Tepidisphaeraceae bacterium]|jgi:predicted kinase|nr:AAA family ATPase [Tepidisphaeraceae bacterium]